MRKNLFTILFATLITFAANAQVHDSTLYRQNKVKEIESWVHVLAFTKSNDTCLNVVKKINPAGHPTYIQTNYNCLGWDMKNEIYYTYNDRYDVTGIRTLQNDNLVSDLTIKVDSFGRILEEVNQFADPPVTVRIRNKYFGEGPLSDSVYTVEVSGPDTTYFMSTNTYQNGQLLKSNTVDVITNKPVNMLTNRYDETGKLTRSEFIYFLGYDNDVITKYTYNEKGQIFRTESELDNIAAEFYYDKKGLPVKVFYYNKFGALEREVWHKYKYYE